MRPREGCVYARHQLHQDHTSVYGHSLYILNVRLPPLPHQILKRLLHRTGTWGKLGADLRGLGNDPLSVGLETLNCCLIPAYYIPALIHTYRQIEKKSIDDLSMIRTTPSGSKVVKVWPVVPNDLRTCSIAAPSVEAMVYVKPGKEVSRGNLYGPNPLGKPEVVAVLGAGNHGFLGLRDILYCLFERNQVPIFKPHPIQADWHKECDYVLEPLIERGFYASFYAQSIAETEAMLHHESIGAIHMTGGVQTHDAIVWGPSAQEQSKRKAANDPLISCPITSELGCITPWIVTPGQWTKDEIKAQAANIAQGVIFNSSCNCNALKVLLLPQGWEQADELLNSVRSVVKSLPALPSWYPGIHKRHEEFHKVFPEAEVVESSGPAIKPSRDFGPTLPLLIAEVPYPEPDQELSPQQKYAFTVEPFAPTLTVVRVPHSSVPDYLKKCTKLANERLWGNLSCTVILHPSVEKEHPEATQEVLDDLQYGAICVNGWSAIPYALSGAVWGAYAGDQTLSNVQSGIGQIGNSHLIDYPLKTLVRGPITGAWVPKPIHTQPIPVGVIRALAGYLVSGWSGIWSSFFAMK